MLFFLKMLHENLLITDFPTVNFNDTTLNDIRIFEPCYLVLYNGHTVEPSKIYGGYLK